LKQWATQHDDWLLVDQDECWFSRFTQPSMHAFAEADENLRMVERTPAKNEADKAIACFGAVSPLTSERWLYFAEGQPNSDSTILFLKALLSVAADKAKRVLVIIWDRASWHKSKQIKQWVRQHNRKIRQKDGVRLLTCLLPSKSPWLNPMEPIWLHSKRKVAEPDGELSVDVLKDRLCSVFNTTIDKATLKPSD
jgi:transposase